MLTQKQIEIVKQTFANITHHKDGKEMTIDEMADNFATPFYDRLFEINHDLAPYFKHLQATKCTFMRVLRTLVDSLGMEDPTAAIKELWERHKVYAREGHFAISSEEFQNVGDALMETIEKCLNKSGYILNAEQSLEIHQSWGTLYNGIVSLMAG